MNKLHAVVQRFRSGSAESDKTPFNLDMDESRTRSYSNAETDTLKDSSPTSGRKKDMDALRLALSRTEALQTKQLENSILSANEVTTLPTVDKKINKKQPTGTFEYMVEEGDTLVKIGAHFDVTPSELIKINRLLSRTVFVGQTLYIPDTKHVSSKPSTPKCHSPVSSSAPQLNTSVASLPSGPDQAVLISFLDEPDKTLSEPVIDPQPQQQTNDKEDLDQEEPQKFLKMPVRRVLEEEQRVSASESFTVKGTLLVTPIAIMFDPDVRDPIVISCEDQQKFSMVVYMEEVKSAALFHDISPRMFWRQPKELRTQSPKPEPYRSGQDKRPKVEGHHETLGESNSLPAFGSSCSNLLTSDNTSSQGDPDKDLLSLDEGDSLTGSKEDVTICRKSEESRECPDLGVEPSELPEGVDLTYSSTIWHIPLSPSIYQTSGSSEQEVCDLHFQEQAAAFNSTFNVEPPRNRSSTMVHIPMSDSHEKISDSSPSRSRHLSFTDEINSAAGDLSIQTQEYGLLTFTDVSPSSVTANPIPISGPRVLILSNSPITCTDVDEDIEAPQTSSTDLQNAGQLKLSENIATDHLITQSIDGSDDHIIEKNPSTEDKSKSAVIHNESQSLLFSDCGVIPQLTENMTSLPNRKNEAGHNSSWTEKAQTVVDKLAFQVSNLSWDSASDSKNGSPKFSDGSPRSSFSPLRTPAHHISNFFNYTSNLFHRPGSIDKDSTSTVHSFTSDKSKHHCHPSSNKFQLKSEFTKEDMSRALGPDLKGFLMRSDSHYFEEAPLYLQIRRGIRKNVEILQPRAFDHWNTGPLVNEYWFVVPREMADKLYDFLMTWQPDAYGDEEETEPRGRFFYDVQSVDGKGQSLGRGGNTVDGLPEDFELYEDHFKEAEKSWEIFSKEDVYRAEKEQAIQRQDTIDESNIPELLGPTVIIKQEHLFAVLRSLPRNMSVGYNWELVYGTHKHGYSLQNLYFRTEKVGFDLPVLLFITDTRGAVFGAYLSNTIKPNDTFYGSGSTFLFTFYPEFKKFPWQGDNQFFMHGDKDFFAVGSGEGLFGLWLDGSLDKGRSHSCPTFMNDVLASEEDFSILQLEVWKFVDSSLC